MQKSITINFQGYPYVYGQHLLKAENGYYITGFVSDPPENKRHIFFARIDKSLNVIRKGLNDSLGNGNTVWDVEFSNDSSDLWIFGGGYGNVNPAGGETRIVFDTNFNYKHANDLGLASGYIDVEWITDTTLLFQSCYPFLEPGPQDQDIGIIETDSSFLIDSADIHYMGATDTIDYPAWSQSLDFRHPDSIFYAGDHDVFPWFYPDVYNYIMVGQLDRSLEPRFEYRFGGDRYYWTSNILATSDGGCLVAASTYDYMTQGYEKDIYILKLKKEDLITSSPDLRSPGPLNVKLYPNPGLDHFTLNSDLKRGVFKLYSMEGKLWKSLRVKERKTKIDVPNLPSGIYYYTISSGSQVHESGKWIKY
ncbi:MAG: T9SS type A sorting domain-containing protein [Bacteroidales bacterium]|nr:T9SS type A sorting domain-containing protein [Bacteroidales bacterium]MCF8388775.1 T9SS type A sorting domain-containing protein [Bacteroidales bacterium]MCF8398336.1 T9SS type A sorting domain-containing protein [Bacteroidales bacterium]